MKKTLFIIVALTVCVVSIWGLKKQQPDLVKFAAQVKTITVYDLRGIAGPKYSEQDLKNAFQASFDPKLFKDLAPSAKFKGGWTIWKGSRLAVVTMKDGAERQLALSYHGGGFAILGETGAFYFEGEARKKWDEACSRITQDVFIPKRHERNKRMEEGKA